jgi:hypothetical protein
VRWFGIVSVAVEVGLSRFEDDALFHKALGSLAARRPPNKSFTRTEEIIKEVT